MLYPTLRLIAGVALRWYYREIAVEGGGRIPPQGPLLLAVNHPNALVDALTVGHVVPRRVRITAKAVLFENPVLGGFLRAVGLIPLRRVSDELARRRDGAAASHVDPARNAEAFRAILDSLDHGAAVLIFPEGISHDGPTLAPLKTGPARIALAARAAGRAAGLLIVPIGLVFESKDAPRSRVLAVIGKPIDAHSWTGASGQTPTADELTAEIARRLNDVVLTAPTPERLAEVQRLAGLAAEILAESVPAVGDVRSLRDVFGIARRLALGLDAMPSMPDAMQAEAAALRQRALRFAADVEAAGIALPDVAISLRTRHGARFAVREAMLLALGGPVALWGRLNHWIPFRLARLIATRDVTARDQPAMRTIVAGLGLVLLAYSVQTTLAWMLAGPLLALAYLVTLPLAADVDLRYSERLSAAWRRMRAYLRLRRNPDLVARLAAERAALATGIRTLDDHLRMWERALQASSLTGA